MNALPDLQTHNISPIYGFLLDSPLTSLPEYFSPWEEITSNLVTLLEEKSLRKKIQQLPLLDHTRLKGYRQMRLAFVQLSFMTNGFVWQDGDEGISRSLPHQIAIPICAIVRFLGTKPIFNYVTLCLSNWRKIDPDGPLHYKNMDTIVSFPGGDSFRFFTVCTAQVELDAVPGIRACVDALHAVVKKDRKAAIEALRVMQTSVEKMKQSLGDMNKELTPEDYYNKLRPFLSGWDSSSSVLPQGLIYEGVSDEPQQVSGGSAAQSSTLATFDATLGISHNSKQQRFLDNALTHMPTLHREFILALRRAPSLRDFVESSKDPDLSCAYNKAVTAIASFRTYHIILAARFITVPSKNAERNKAYENIVNKGTGGTDLIPFLKNVRDTTNTRIVSGRPLPHTK